MLCAAINTNLKDVGLDVQTSSRWGLSAFLLPCLVEVTFVSLVIGFATSRLALSPSLSRQDVHASYTLVRKAASYVVFAYPIHFFWWSNLARIGNKTDLHPDQEGNGPRSSLRHGPELKGATL